jgi:hypothetical protein
MRKVINLMVLLLFLGACEKEELALLPPVVEGGSTPIDTSGGNTLIEKGALYLSAVSMESDYKNQVWFDLGTNSIVKTNLRTDWDLAFDCSSSQYIVYLNTALNASVALTNETDFITVSSDAGLTYRYEHQSGKVDSLAIGDVSNQRNVFIVNRGFSPSGVSLGKWKIQITQVQNGDYHLTCSKLNGSDLQTAIISKKSTYNRVAYSFTTASELQIEPPKTDYDLCFTQYTHVFTDPPYPYSVNGVLINSYQTEVAEAFKVDFNSIDYTYATTLSYSNDQDVIGYDWKSFNLQDNTYNIATTQNYLIRDAANNLFKLRFIDFYDENGVKGTPGFELVRL